MVVLAVFRSLERNSLSKSCIFLWVKISAINIQLGVDSLERVIPSDEEMNADKKWPNYKMIHTFNLDIVRLPVYNCADGVWRKGG